MCIRKVVSAIFVSVATFACWLGAVGPAWGAFGHNYETRISGVGLSEPFGSPWGIAFDSSGRLFVADPGSAIVDVFDPSNALLTQAGKGFLSGEYARSVGISRASGDIYVGDSNKSEVFVMKPDGAGGYEGLSTWQGNNSAAGSFGGGCCYVYTAVDNSTSPSDPRAGDVYVLSTQSPQVVDVFKPKPAGSEEALEGELVGELSAASGFSFGESDGLAVDAATGNVYVADPGNKVVKVFSDQGSEEPLLALSGTETPQGASFTPIAVAIDDMNEMVYVVDGSAKAVDEFSKAGAYFGQITATPSGELAEPRGVAVQEHAGATQGDVYVSDHGAKVVDVFGTGVVLADVKSEPASNVRRTAVTLNGTVNPDEVPVTACTFEYRSSEEASFTHAEACPTSPGSGNALVAVSAEVSGLTPGMTYYYRLAATNANGTNRGGEESFTTSLAVDGVSTGPAEEVTASGAKLTGSLSPDGTDAHYNFEYGTTTSYGSTSPAPPGIDAGTGGSGCVPPGGGTCQPVQAETTLGGLQPETTYHYRIVATNELGTSYGQDETLTTRPSVDGVSTGPAEEVTASGAKLTGSLSPDGTDAHYYFEYGTTTSYGSTSPAPPGIDAGTGGSGCVPPGGGTCAPVAAATTIGGLEPGTSYHYRLVATNTIGTTYGEDESFVTSGPVIGESSVIDVAATSATMQVEIDPHNLDTAVYFQYGTSVSYGSVVPDPPGTDIGGGEVGVAVSAHAQGLLPATTYHYRVVAVQGTEVFNGPDRTFATQSAGGSLALPDARQWELVSPPSKQGATLLPIEREGGLIQAAADGSAIAYIADSPTEASPGGDTVPQYIQVLSNRHVDSGWSSQDIGPHHDTAVGYQIGSPTEFLFFSANLSRALFEPHGEIPTPLSPEATEKTTYMRDDSTGVFTPLVNAGNVTSGEKFGGQKFGNAKGINFAGASPDMSHIVLGSEVPLLAGEKEGGLYEWAGGRLAPVSVSPNGEEKSFSALGGTNVTHAISNDGSRVIWTDNAEEHLYLRDMARGETLQIGGPAANFELASADDSRLFFDGQVCEVKLNETTDKLECVVTSVGGSAIGASEDGSYVYVIAGGTDIYLRHYNGEQGKESWEQPVLVATISSEDSADWVPGSERFMGPLTGRTSRVSPNGRYFTFMSSQRLTGYDNTDANTGAADEEVFVYDASTGRLACASCDPSGARPVGVFDPSSYPGLLVDRPQIWQNRMLAASIPGWTGLDLSRAQYQSRYLSDDGRLFFDSADALVPQDSNGLEDVYEYEPQGVGNCKHSSATFNESSGGCVNLISSGTSGDESAFMDASENGSDVFFLTTSGLAPEDYDGSFDLYDAHECSGESPCPALAAAAPPACSTADSCKAAPSPRPTIFGSPASSTFAGEGNLTVASIPVAKRPKSKPKRASKNSKHKHKHKKAKRKTGKRAKRSKTTKSLSSGTRR